MADGMIADVVGTSGRPGSVTLAVERPVVEIDTVALGTSEGSVIVLDGSTPVSVMVSDGTNVTTLDGRISMTAMLLEGNTSVMVSTLLEGIIDEILMEGSGITSVTVIVLDGSTSGTVRVVDGSTTIVLEPAFGSYCLISKLLKRQCTSLLCAKTLCSAKV